MLINLLIIVMVTSNVAVIAGVTIMSAVNFVKIRLKLRRLRL